MKRESAIALALACPLLVLALLTGHWLDRSRSQAGLVPSAGRIPLAGLEPLVVDLMWMRADNLLAERRFPEAVASIRIVTELQPRVPENWEILGHLLAWRTSESSGDPKVHWRWAKEGIEVVERGLEHNPDAPGLLLELGNLYLQRVAFHPDVALEAERDLGVPPTERAAAAFRRLYDVWDNPEFILNYAEAVRLLGIRLAELGETSSALQRLREARDLLQTLAGGPEGPLIAGKAEEIERTIDELEGR